MGASDYRRQWREGVRRVLEGYPRSAVVLSYSGPAGDAYQAWAPMWRAGDAVHIQRHWLTAESVGAPVEPSRLYDLVGDLELADEEGQEFMTWTVTVADLAAFLERPVG